MIEAASPTVFPRETGSATEDYSRAVLNILDDFSAERSLLRDTQRAVLNILEDVASEKSELESTPRAILNILDDFAAEKDRLEAAQKAMLNLLEDFDAEKVRAERTSLDLEQALGERGVLLQEVHHRVKNNLQVVSSLLGLQASHFKDRRLRETLEDSQNRVLSIALVHENLYGSEDLSRVEFSDYVRNLVDNLPRSSGQESGITVTLEVEDSRISIETAVPCGLIINELITNAFKHAFPGGRRGSICVGLRRVDSDNWMLRIADDGIGLAAGFDMKESKTLGLELVNLLVKQLDGTLEINRNGGTAFQLTFPVGA